MREGVSGKTVKPAGSPLLYSESCRDEATCSSALASHHHTLGPGSFSQAPLSALVGRCGPAGTSVTGEADDLNPGFSFNTVQLGGHGSAPVLGLLLSSEHQRILKDRNYGTDHNDNK